ncbi:MAG: hypothetical protein K2K45_03025 [Muribaculaceae bacterium]|nr:hypothetical protein [Muribaculaceae bacterium]
MDNNFKKAYDWKNSGYILPPITSRKKLDEAEELWASARELSASDPDALDGNRINDLVCDIDFAGSRHWTFQWQIIVGAIISVFILNWCSSNKEEDIKQQETIVENINAWQPNDTTIEMESFKTHDIASKFISVCYESPTKYKALLLERAGRKYYSTEGLPEYYEKEINNPSASDEWREKCKENLKEAKETWPTKKKELLAEYDRVSKLKFNDIQQLALQEATKKLDSHKSSRSNMKFWFWFLIICIPLYIIACRPYGYTMNKYELEAKTLNVIQRIGLWLSGGLVAVAGALQFRTIITKWSDGRTTSSDDGMGPAIAAAKIALIVGAVLVFCFTCCFIMAYATIVGLIRNYNWAAIISGAKKRTSK